MNNSVKPKRCEECKYHDILHFYGGGRPVHFCKHEKSRLTINHVVSINGTRARHLLGGGIWNVKRAPHCEFFEWIEEKEVYENDYIIDTVDSPTAEVTPETMEKPPKRKKKEK